MASMTDDYPALTLEDLARMENLGRLLGYRIGASPLISDITEQERIGNARYVVSWHEAGKTHPDGSPFREMRVFSNRRAKDRFVKTLRARAASTTASTKENS